MSFLVLLLLAAVLLPTFTPPAAPMTLSRYTPESPLLRRIPRWVWVACIPVVGGFAVILAGWQIRQATRANAWLLLAVVLLACNLIGVLVDPLATLIPLAWLGQMTFALGSKRTYVIATAPRGSLLPTTSKLAAQLARVHGKVDVNNASKDDLVHFLGIPIVYANILHEFQKEGICFEDLEHLKTITGIPGEYVDHLAPLLTYGVRYQQELNYSWHRLNTLAAAELAFWGLSPEVAEKVVEERQRHGPFQSVLEVRARTGISLGALKAIM